MAHKLGSNPILCICMNSVPSWDCVHILQDPCASWAAKEVGKAASLAATREAYPGSVTWQCIRGKTMTGGGKEQPYAGSAGRFERAAFLAWNRRQVMPSRSSESHNSISA